MRTRQGVVVGIVAGAIGVLVAPPLAGTAAVLPQPTAGSAVPQLTVPSATVPSVSTPGGTTPSVTTPPITTPPVTTPPVTAPPVRTTASKVSALVGGATHSAQASGALGDPASAAPDPTGATRLAGGSSTRSSGGSGAAAAPGMARTAHAALTRGRDTAAGRRSARARRIAATRESRRLRRLVASLHGCLRTLGVGAQRLLTLRAGLDGSARSAAATARILRVSTGREARLERMALIALQRSAGTGCAGPATVVARALASAGTLSLSAPQLSAAPPASSPTTASLSAAHTQRPPRGGRTPNALRPGVTLVERADTSSSFPSLLIPALLALLLGLALIGLPETRRRLRPAGGHAGAGRVPRYQKSAKTVPTAAPIAYSAIAPPRRSSPPGTVAARTEMDDTLEQMAANIVAQMKRDSPLRDPHAEAEVHGLDTHVDVERELLPQEPDSRPHPAPWGPRVSAREHATQAALAATVIMSGLMRVRRRARRRRGR